MIGQFTQVGGFAVLKNSTSLQSFSSVTKPVPLSVLIDTAAADDVKTTRLTVLAFTHAFRTFSTPWTAGLIMSFCFWEMEKVALTLRCNSYIEFQI